MKSLKILVAIAAVLVLTFYLASLGGGSPVNVLQVGSDQDLAIGDILIIPIVIAIVQLLKSCGMPKRYAPWANLVLMVVGFGLVKYTEFRPEATSWVVLTLQILVRVLAATGFYRLSEDVAIRYGFKEGSGRRRLT